MTASGVSLKPLEAGMSAITVTETRGDSFFRVGRRARVVFLTKNHPSRESSWQPERFKTPLGKEDTQVAHSSHTLPCAEVQRRKMCLWKRFFPLCPENVSRAWIPLGRNLPKLPNRSLTSSPSPPPSHVHKNMGNQSCLLSVWSLANTAPYTYLSKTNWVRSMCPGCAMVNMTSEILGLEKIINTHTHVNTSTHVYMHTHRYAHIQCVCVCIQRVVSAVKKWIGHNGILCCH